MYIAFGVSSMKVGNLAAVCAHSIAEAEKKCESPCAGGM
jgi:hypothetical protein